MYRVLSRFIFCASKPGSSFRIANHTRPRVAAAETTAHNDTKPNLRKVFMSNRPERYSLQRTVLQRALTRCSDNFTRLRRSCLRAQNRANPPDRDPSNEHDEGLRPEARNCMRLSPQYEPQIIV